VTIRYQEVCDIKYRLTSSVIFTLFVWVTCSVQAVFIDAVRVKPKHLITTKEMRCLLEAPVPGEWNETVMELTRQHLLATQRFTDVVMEVQHRENSKELIFQVTPAQYVKRFKVFGEHQLNGKKVIAASRLKKFTQVEMSLIPEAVQNILRAYSRAGFPDPEVEITLDDPNYDGGTRVLINIQETRLPIPKDFQIHLSGHPGVFSKIRILSYMNYFRWQTNRNGFNRIRLEKELKKSEKRFRLNRYLEAEFTIQETSIDATSTASGDVQVNLDVGIPHKLKLDNTGYKVRRDVKKAWQQRRLKLTELEKRRLLRNTKNTLRGYGYLDAEVTPRDVVQTNRKEFVITAERGERHWVAVVEFEGNVSIGDEELLKVTALKHPRIGGLLKSYPGPILLKEDEKRLIGYYAGKGFPKIKVDARLKHDTSYARTVVFEIDEGPQVRISEIQFKGNSGIENSILAGVSELATGELFRISRVKEGATLIRQFYLKNGYLDIDVQYSVEELSETQAGVLFKIVEGTFTRFGATVIRGNFKTHSNLILRARDFEENEPISLEKLSDAQNEMFDVGVFDAVAIRTEKDPENPEKRITIFDVTERSSGLFTMGVDVNTDRGFELSGRIAENNLLGHAVQAMISGVTGEQRVGLSAQLKSHYLLQWKLPSIIKVSYEDDQTHESFGLTTWDFSTGVTYPFTKSLEGSLRYQLIDEAAFDVEPDVEAGVDYETGRFGSVTPRLDWDTRDDPFITQKGFLVSNWLKVSSHYLGGDLEFSKLESDIRYFKDFDGFFTVAVSLRGGWAWEASDTELPLSERFFLGGASSHRAFKHNDLGPKGDDDSPLGGEAFLFTSTEFRFQIWEALHGAVFFDLGNTWFDEPDSINLRPGAGIGLRFHTPIGPIRGDLGFNLDPDTGEDDFVFHFAIGHAF